MARPLKADTSGEAVLKVPTGRRDDPSAGARISLPGQVSEAASALAATEAPEQPIPILRLSDLQLPSTRPSKDSIGSTITVIPAEERLSDPDVFPAPHRPVRSRPRLAMVGGLVGLILAIALTAFIAIGQLPPDIWRRLTVERAIELASSWARPAPATPPMRAELATPRLIVHRRVVLGEPAALGLAVQGGAESAVIIRGLLPGMELSNGDAVAADASQVAATALGKTWIAPPESFIGSADLVAELRLPDNKIADRLAIRLEWGSPISPEPTQGPSDREEPPISPASAPPQLDRQQIVAGPPISPELTQGPSDREEPPISPASAPPQLDRQQIVAGPPISAEPTQGPSDREEPMPPISPASAPRQLDRQQIVAGPPKTQGPSDREEPGPPISTVPAPRQLNEEEIAVLLKRGKDLIATGDLAAARLVLQRAADANDVEAILALAATYDPYVLRELKVYSFAADTGMARTWYEKARQLGSSAALRRLDMLTSGAR
jgi:hypothetical protein